MTRLVKEMGSEQKGQYVEQVTQKLLEKTKSSQGKFNFQ